MFLPFVKVNLNSLPPVSFLSENVLVVLLFQFLHFFLNAVQIGTELPRFWGSWPMPSIYFAKMCSIYSLLVFKCTLVCVNSVSVSFLVECKDDCFQRSLLFSLDSELFVAGLGNWRIWSVIKYWTSWIKFWNHSYMFKDITCSFG